MTVAPPVPPIRMLLLDVDGVLTDGTLWYDESGEAVKPFNVRDGLAVALLRAHGVLTGVLSGRSSPSLRRRIADLAIAVSATGKLEKLAALDEILADTGLSPLEVAYVGDDVVDLPLVGVVGMFYAPADAHPLVLQRAQHILQARGGSGAAREAAEHLLLSRGMQLADMYEPLLGDWGRYDAKQ